MTSVRFYWFDADEVDLVHIRNRRGDVIRGIFHRNAAFQDVLCAADARRNVLARNAGSMPKIVHRLPDSADTLIATLKLKAMGIRLDILTGAQDTYLHSWQEGT
jgi:hypothetical protein